MVDASFSRQRYREDRAARAVRRRLLIPLVAAFLFVGAGLSLVWGFGGTAAPSPANEQVSSELIETTKGLQVTQQEAIDQLQVVQDQLAAQRAEIDRIDRRERRQVAEAETDRQSMATKRWADAPSNGRQR